MDEIIQKCICLGLNHSTFTLADCGRKSNPYYLGHFTSVAGGQKAIKLTAVKNKSFEGEQVWISILEYLFSTWKMWCDRFLFHLELLAILWDIHQTSPLIGWVLKICCWVCAQNYADCYWTAPIAVHPISPQFIVVRLSWLTISGRSQIVSLY